jgi:hypothetical protein
MTEATKNLGAYSTAEHLAPIFKASVSNLLVHLMRGHLDRRKPCLLVLVKVMGVREPCH